MIACIEMNLFALVVLFLMFISLQSRLYGKYYDHKLYIILICLNAVELILNTMILIVEGKPGNAAIRLNLLLTVVYYILTPISCMVWSLYAYYQVCIDEMKTKKLFIPLVIPVIINAVISVLSCFNKYYFYVDKSNQYYRGNIFFLFSLVCVSYLLFTQIVIFIKRKQISKPYFIPLSTFAIPPLIGGIIQSIYYGTSLVWVCMTISLLIIYINIMNNETNTDYLTGLYNRRQLDNSLQKYNLKNKLLGGIMIDLNSFKKINDAWGHLSGDKALKYTGEILKKSFHEKDIICRYGGDEFIVLFEIKETSDLVNAVNRIKMNLKDFKHNSSVPYVIEFSFGYDIYDCNSGVSIQKFIEHIDSLMYKNKKESYAGR